MSLVPFALTVHAVLLLLEENSSNHYIMQMYLLSLDLLLSTLLLPPRVCCTLYHDESVETYASLDRKGVEPIRYSWYN